MMQEVPDRRDCLQCIKEGAKYGKGQADLHWLRRSLTALTGRLYVNVAGARSKCTNPPRQTKTARDGIDQKQRANEDWS